MDLPLNILNLDLEKGPEEVTTPNPTVHKPLLKIITEKRRGKQATIIFSDDPIDDHTAAELAQKLKQQLAVGGSNRDGEILLQGNQKEKATQILKQLGYKVK